MKINGHDVKQDAKCFNADGVDLNERELNAVREDAEHYAKQESIDPNDVSLFVEPHATGFICGLDYPGREQTSLSDLDILSREGWPDAKPTARTKARAENWIKARIAGRDAKAAAKARAGDGK